MNAINPNITASTQLSDLLAHAQDLCQYKADYIGQAGKFTFLPDGTMTNKAEQTGLFASASMTPGKLTEWAMNQAFEKLGKAYKEQGLKSMKSDYMRALEVAEPDLFALNMNRAIARVEDKEKWTVRTYTDPTTGQNTVRAVVSDQYLILDNVEMLQLLNQVLTVQDALHRISNRSFVTADNMSVDVLFDDIETGKGNGNGQFKVGVRIRNGETGNWKGGIYPIAKRTSCDNSITTDNREMCFEFKHFGKNTAASKRVLMNAKIGEVLPFAADIVNSLIEAEEYELPKFSDIVHGMAEKHGWSESFTGTVFAGSEARWSLAGLVNGITFAAHTQATSPEHMVESEFLAGDFLFGNAESMLEEAVAIHNSKTKREAAREARKQAKAAKTTTQIEL
ncbi:MAG TPA: hypothetical protein VIY48_19460 [Candidatus Paceibacterota bacterium]